MRLSTSTNTLDRAIDSALEDQRLVGGVVLVSHHGERVYERAAGLADREAGTPFRPDTIVRFASVTKPFVSIAALRLIDQGVLGLDDRVSDWLPAFRPALPECGEAVITIRHLLTHSSGLGYRFAQPADGSYAQADISDGLDLPGRSLEDNLARIASVPLFFEPGSSWRYSVATDVLGAVLQAATGLTLPDVVAAQVTAPLELTEAGFTVAAPERLATPYVNDSPQPHRLSENELVTREEWGEAVGVRFAPSRTFDLASFPSGGGGMTGTASDVLALLEAVRLDAADGQQRLLRQNTAQSVFVGQIGDLLTEPGKTFSFAGSVVVDPLVLGTPQAVGTLAWGGVYGHSWFVDPVQELTVVILTNTMYEGMSGQLTLDIRDAAYATVH